MPDFETRLKDVSHAAWLIWTANGLGLDDFGLEQTSKSATDAANNAYVEGISAKDWVDDTLMPCAAKTWAMRNDFDRRPVSDLGFLYISESILRRFGAGTRQGARAGKIEINLNQVSGARSDQGTAEGSQLISAAFQLLNLPCEAADADQATAPRAAFSGRHGLGPAA